MSTPVIVHLLSALEGTQISWGKGLSVVWYFVSFRQNHTDKPDARFTTGEQIAEEVARG